MGRTVKASGNISLGGHVIGATDATMIIPNKAGVRPWHETLRRVVGTPR
jgi:hypothetical protein